MSCFLIRRNHIIETGMYCYCCKSKFCFQVLSRLSLSSSLSAKEINPFFCENGPLSLFFNLPILPRPSYLLSLLLFPFSLTPPPPCTTSPPHLPWSQSLTLSLSPLAACGSSPHRHLPTAQLCFIDNDAVSLCISPFPYRLQIPPYYFHHRCAFPSPILLLFFRMLLYN